MPAYDLDHFLSLTRLDSLALRPDGGEVAATVAGVAPDGTKMRTSVWAIDLTGEREPQRLTRSAQGESSVSHLPDGSSLFVSSRPDPDSKPGGDGDPVAGLWRLPAGRGEAVLVMSPPGGIGGVEVAGRSGHVAVAVDVFPDADDLAADAERADAREEAGVAAQLFEELPIRLWDHYLGPRTRRYFVLEPSASPSGFGEPRQIAVGDDALESASFALTPDGSTLVFTRRLAETTADVRVDLVAVDVESGDERVLTASDAMYTGVAADHTGHSIACVRVDVSEDDARDATVWVIDLASGTGRDLTPDLDLMPTEIAWSHDDGSIMLVADERGHRPVYVVDATAGEPRRVTASGSFSGLNPTQDGGHVIAMYSAVDRPAAPVRVALDDGELEPLPSPASATDVPGGLIDVEATADDGATIRSWLALPDDAGADRPAPLVAWVHGGPVGSWNDWSWRWNPWLLVERGYAVLLPDPAISTGYGRDFLRRGHADWGNRPYTDVMAAVDGAVDRPDVDGDRTALMGGSFGGYMANWIAGHTGRFRCIVTHAGLWALDQFQGTTDMPPWWELEFGDPYADRSRLLEHSPHLHVGSITTPMLVIHGELDHRVPIGEALRLWTDLRRHDVESKFLYFPDEHHWILKPQNARLWYETVLAWLDHHVLAEDWRRPDLL